MARSITVLDKLDGSGIAATLAGFTAGAAVNVYRSAGGGGAPWALAASRSGDGPVDVPAAAGFWGLYAAEAAAPELFAPPALGWATNLAESVYYRCVVAVAQGIAGLVLPGIGARVHVGLTATGKTGNRYFPFCEVSIEGVAESLAAVLNITTDRGYPVRVQFEDNAHPFDEAKAKLYTAWREAAIDLFHERHLPTVPESSHCVVEPFTVADPNLPTYQHYVSGLIVRAWCRH